MTKQVYLAYVLDLLVRVRDGSPAVPGINGGQPFAGLRPDLKVVLELSNEIWNPGFPVYWWMMDQADRKGITFYEQVAGQIELVFFLANQVFSGPHAARLETYVGGMLGMDVYLQGVLSALRPTTHVDSAGCAAYFGPRPSVINNWLIGYDSVSGACPNCPMPFQVLNAAQASISEVRQKLRLNKLVADLWVNPDGSRPRFAVYEAGQSFVAGFQPWADAANAAQVLPRMYDIYTQHLVPMLIQEDVTLVNWYSFMTDQELQGANGIGPFGIWDNMSQQITLPVPAVYVDEGAPKAAAIYRGPPLGP
jgi:hypothetical protein